MTTRRSFSINIAVPSGAWTGIVLLLVFLGVECLIFGAAWRERDYALESLESRARQATEAKARQVAEVFTDLYVTTRTISLLPALRRPPPKNRGSSAEDVIESRRFNRSDAETVRQLYFHVAEMLSVSEIYIVYDGFAPERGEIPFLMFDSEVAGAAPARMPGGQTAGQGRNPDAAAEEEGAEYQEIVAQLAAFRRSHPLLPEGAPRGLPMAVSKPLMTCDNTQFPSLAKGQERNREGVLFSVPIYDPDTQAFKGQVTTVVRMNVFEARLLDWPQVPVSEIEKAQAAGLGFDRTPPSEYVLTRPASGITVADRRNQGLAEILAGHAAAGLSLSLDLGGPAGQGWVLTRHVPQAAFDAIRSKADHEIALRSAVAAGVTAAFAVLAWLLARQRRAAADLLEHADFDALTGLPNRRQLDRLIEEGLTQAQADGTRLALVLADLDNFKTINDTHGHHVGDLLLVEVARRFQKQLNAGEGWTEGAALLAARRSARCVGRLGGDEFVVLLPRIQNEAEACAVSERLLSTLAVPLILDGHTIQVRASLGLAVFPDHGKSAAQLLRNADQAMYAAKRIDDSAVVAFQQEVDAAAVRRLRLTADLRDAMSHQHLVLHYQPVVNLQRVRVDCAEALMRWHHTELGWISPAEFVPLLERSGLIVPVGLWVLRQACAQLCAWRDAGSTIASVAVNVSVVQLMQEDFSRQALEIIGACGVDPGCVTIEVTESVLMDNPDRSIAQLDALRRGGVRVAIDDFGSGFSSLSYLRRLPVQVLKIDRSLLVDAVNASGRSILAAVVDLAHQLGLDCVAEGVETLEQYRLLREVGCHRLQGYLFARPLPADEADAAARRMNLEPLASAGGGVTESVFGQLHRAA